ncbi:hypothetical protein GI364_04465 [Alicyclobacillus sp. SO9]|nr:hypothetical protein GI364_04465 [Alicyclobacillus sp. SO9]
MVLRKPIQQLFLIYKEETHMYGTFGGYTRWAVVFLIIFVLFFLLVPGYTTTTSCTTTPVY